ncbi:DUF3224 domain-containing protein [Emcibacter sp.]|uniref:DUF3224 domain-containing protein n=1 Tax=Emcibacter sp. TaxID=1979954 RepID=UPI003A8D2C0E
MTRLSDLKVTMPCLRLTPGAFVLSFLASLILAAPGHTSPAKTQKDQNMMTATGEFDVKLVPQDDGDFSAGRLTLDKTFQGDLTATSKGQMLSHRSTTDQTSAGYVALETVTGTLAGRKGSFALLHRGLMQDGDQELVIMVSPGSGSGELEGLSGQMAIRIEDGKHFYDFEYQLGE